MFLFLFISSVSVTCALQWTSSTTFPNGSRLDVCAGANVTLPWVFNITTSEHVHYVKWFTSQKNLNHSEILLAVNTSEQFILSSKDGPSINFVSNAGLQLFGLSGIHSAYYSVHVYLGDTCNLYTQTAYVHVSEAPVTIDGSLHAITSADRVFQPHTGEWTVQLECGKFLFLGHPPINVVWKTPSNKTVQSSFHNNSTFFLTLPNPLNNGGYSCQLDGTSPAVQCLQSDSLINHVAVVTIDGFEKRLSTLEGRLEALQEETVNMHGPVSEMADAINRSQTEMKLLLDEVSGIRENNDNLTSQMRELRNQSDQLKEYFRTYNFGSSYTHWGSDNCSSSAETVYSGTIGGSYSGHTGAAANHLCLPPNPVYDQHVKPPNCANLYGGEYDTGSSTQNFDPTCSVCRSPHSTNIMIPATNTCTPGWTREYSGYLMAGYHGNNAATEYICVDSRFNYVPNSKANQDSALLYYTVSTCGSLQCPPYIEGKIVTCVVCSK